MSRPLSDNSPISCAAIFHFDNAVRVIICVCVSMIMMMLMMMMNRCSALIAVAVYLVGGCVYQRNVMHQRGWRQLPNYAIWAGIGSFVKVFVLTSPGLLRRLSALRGGRGWQGRESSPGSQPSSLQDVFIIATSTCARLVPRRRGYNQLTAGRGRSSDDENRLIDQLDEDWDD